MSPARPEGTPQMHGHSQNFHHHQAHNHDNHPRSPNNHQIQFYNGEDSLFDSVSRFILPSFFSDEHAAIIVASKAHLGALDLYLRQQNLVPELLRKREQMLLAPAEGILEQLMPNGKVEGKIFFDFFTPLFEKLQEQYPKLLVYGELVNVLCENGEHEQAHELEEVWESFLEGKEASLLCGYNLNVFARDGLEDVFQRICRSHSHVMPAEEATNGNAFGRPEDQPMILAMLQQKNLRLEAEMARRVALESVLNATMEHIGTRPAEAIQVLERDGSMSLLRLPAVGVVSAMTNDGVTDYYFNHRFLEISGLTRMSVEAEPGWVGAVHYQDRERVSHNIRLVDRKTRRMEYRFVLPDGSIRWVVGESVSREAGYVHSAVDITVLRTEVAPPLPSVLPALPVPPSARSRSGSTASGNNVEPSPWANTHLAGHKRSIGFSHISSPSVPSSGSGCPSPVNAILARSSPNDLKVASDLTRLTQLLWENLFSHPPLLHPPSPDSAEANIATKLSALYNWYREQPLIFMPGSSTFDINIDALQKANIRLAHIEFFGSIILLSRYPLIRAIERGDLPRDTAQPRQETAAGSRKHELDDLQYAEGCIEAAIKVLSHVQTLVAPIPPSTSNTSSLAIFAEHGSDVRSCRAVLGVFFAAATTVLLHLSLQPEGSAGFRDNEGLLETVSGIIDNLVALPETQDMTHKFRATLGPFVSALRARHHSRYPESTPLGVPAKALIADITALLKHPTVGVEWLPFEGPFWTWQDLLSAPRLGPVGDRMVGDARSSSSDRTYRGGEEGSSPTQGAEKRAKISNEESSPSTAVRSSMEVVEEWNSGRAAVSKELEALFNKNNPPAT